MEKNFLPFPDKEALVYDPNIDFILTWQGIGCRTFEGMSKWDFDKTLLNKTYVDKYYETDKGGKRKPTFVNMK